MQISSFGDDPFSQTSEKELSLILRETLSEVSIDESFLTTSQFDALPCSLDIFTSILWLEAYRGISYESLDGIFPEIATKTGERSAYVLGNAVWVSDQSVTPIELKLELSESAVSVAYFECKLSEEGSERNGKIRQVAGRQDRIDWRYHFGYDHRGQSD
ncbi:MAG: hypothetical protein AAF497_09840 [Planctomycetota bacterium]